MEKPSFLNRITKAYTIRILLLVMTLEGAACLILSLSLPRSADNPWFLGYSPKRMVVILGLLAINLVLVWFTARIWREPGLEQRINKLLNHLAIDKRLSAWILTILSAGLIVAVLPVAA